MEVRESELWIGDVLGVTVVPASDDFGTVAVNTMGGVAVATTRFGGVDTGLTAADAASPTEVRCELITMIDPNLPGGEPALAPADVARAALTTAARVLAEGELSPHPGTLIPGLADRAGLEGITARHGMLVSPLIWGGPVPQYTEDPGRVGGTDAVPGVGRLTLVLQLVMLTDNDKAVVDKYGPRPLLAVLGEEDFHSHDWYR